jgi:hypothetical protein
MNKTHTIGLAVAAAAWLAAPTASRADVVYSYVFAPDASLTFADNNTEKVSGAFTVDTTTATATISSGIELMGPSPESGIFNNGPSINFPEHELFVLNESGTAHLLIFFTSPFGASVLPLSTDTLIQTFPGGEIVNYDVTSAVDGADLVTAPEPSALALLGTALAGLFLFRSGANR